MKSLPATSGMFGIILLGVSVTIALVNYEKKSEDVADRPKTPEETNRDDIVVRYARDHLRYYHDEKTDTCFAFMDLATPHAVMTAVPCHPKTEASEKRSP